MCNSCKKALKRQKAIAKWGGVLGVWKDMTTCDLTYQIPISKDNGVLFKHTWYIDSIIIYLFIFFNELRFNKEGFV